MDLNEIKKKALATLNDDIKIINGIQWVPVTDVKAALSFAMADVEKHTAPAYVNNEIANMSEVFEMVKEAMDQSKALGLEIEVLGQAMISLKKNPNLMISQALAEGLENWDV